MAGDDGRGEDIDAVNGDVVLVGMQVEGILAGLGFDIMAGGGIAGGGPDIKLSGARIAVPGGGGVQLLELAQKIELIARLGHAVFAAAFVGDRDVAGGRRRDNSRLIDPGLAGIKVDDRTLPVVGRLGEIRIVNHRRLAVGDGRSHCFGGRVGQIKAGVGEAGFVNGAAIDEYLVIAFAQIPAERGFGDGAVVFGPAADGIGAADGDGFVVVCFVGNGRRACPNAWE